MIAAISAVSGEQGGIGIFFVFIELARAMLVRSAHALSGEVVLLSLFRAFWRKDEGLDDESEDEEEEDE